MAAILALAISASACAPIEPAAPQTGQLAAEAQWKLDALGLSEVDASGLSLRQLAALKLTVPAATPASPGWLRARQKAKAILRRGE